MARSTCSFCARPIPRSRWARWRAARSRCGPAPACWTLDLNQGPGREGILTITVPHRRHFMGTVEPQVATDAQAQTIDGFQLVIDALKLNGTDTIYGLPGIPITDLTRRAQADG